MGYFIKTYILTPNWNRLKEAVPIKGQNKSLWSMYLS